MPTQAFGVYPAEETEATEVSSTYEGRHVTLLASECVHAGAVVTKGMPVVWGTVGLKAVGIAFNTEVAGTDLIAIDTEGIWNVEVVASDDGGDSLVVGGDRLYINVATCIVSKIANIATQIPFGLALGQVVAAGTAVIAVKVHQDPHWEVDMQIRKTLDEADPTVNFGAYSAAFKIIVDSDIAQTGGRLCALSTNLEPAALAMQDVLGAEIVTYIGAGAIAGYVTGLFVEVQGGSTSIAGSFHGLSVYAAPGSNPTGNSHVVRLESNPSTVTWMDSFINFVGNPNFTFYHSGLGTAGASTGTHTTGPDGWMLVNMGGATRYIQLYTS